MIGSEEAHIGRSQHTQYSAIENERTTKEICHRTYPQMWSRIDVKYEELMESRR